MTKHPENKYQRVQSEKKKRTKSPKESVDQKHLRCQYKRSKDKLKDTETQDELTKVLVSRSIYE